MRRGVRWRRYDDVRKGRKGKVDGDGGGGSWMML